MAVYRFRITFEEAEDVYREIDIQGKQTFEDLHRAIQEAIGFDNSKDASFYMSDDYWHRGEEIVLNERKNDDDDDDDDRSRKSSPKLMSKCKIVSFIDDPHQKMLYVFDPAVQWSFYVELIKIVTEDPKHNYPKCTRSVGAAPKQYKVVTAPPVDDDEFADADEEDDNRKERVFQADEEYDEEDRGSDSDEEEAGSDSEEGEEGDSPSEEGGEEMGGFAQGGEEDF